MAKLFGEEVKKIRKYGAISIFVNTCRVSQNWRNVTGEVHPKYELNDESLMVNPHKMEGVFDKMWSMLCKTHDNTFQYDEMDIEDSKRIIANSIGSSFVSFYQSDYPIIKDGNQNIEHSLNLKIPDYLITEVEINLRTKNLI
jgi:outer membrane phospholipase A